MSPAVERLKPTVDQLSIFERAELVEYLLHALSRETQDVDLINPTHDEILRRISEVHSDTSQRIPYAEVVAQLRSKY